MCCSHLVFIQWLQHHLLTCPFKYLTGIDCPGCGFQRSLIALVQGNFHQSLALYPPTIPCCSILPMASQIDVLSSIINKKPLKKRALSYSDRLSWYVTV